MLVGDAHVSTIDQNPALQIRGLKGSRVRAYVHTEGKRRAARAARAPKPLSASCAVEVLPSIHSRL